MELGLGACLEYTRNIIAISKLFGFIFLKTATCFKQV